MAAFSDRRTRRARRSGTVVPLNRGSTSYGSYSALPLNTQGGTFGSGRTAGGGAGAGVTLAQALVAPAPSVAGKPEVGPPPVAPSPPSLAAPPSESTTYYPTFTPHPVVQAFLQSLYPTFRPTTYSGGRMTAY